jgi:hypothetical protein
MTGDKEAMESQDESARKPHGIESIELVGDTDQGRVTRERGRRLMSVRILWSAVCASQQNWSSDVRFGSEADIEVS